MMSRAALALAFTAVLLAPLGVMAKRYRYYDDGGVLATRVDRWTGRVAALECVEILPPETPAPSILPAPPRGVDAPGNGTGSETVDAASLSAPPGRRCSWTDRHP